MFKFIKKGTTFGNKARINILKKLDSYDFINYLYVKTINHELWV
jgi:hypothetical protein